MYRKLNNLAAGPTMTHTRPLPNDIDTAPARFAWAVTGSGHGLVESLEIAATLLPHVDLFLSRAAQEVLPLYQIDLAQLKQRFRVFRDNSASAVPVGMLYDETRYHTVVVTKSPLDWVELRPRNIELDNVARLRQIDHCHVVCSLDELRAALDARIADIRIPTGAPDSCCASA